LTGDLGRRSYITRIKKKAGERWEKDGKLLEQYVPEHWEFYLGCIFAVIREWLARGKPVDTTASLRFLQWERVLDYIVPHIVGAGLPRPTEELVEKQEQMSEPAHDFGSALWAVVMEGEENDADLPTAYTALALWKIAEANDLEVPGRELHGGRIEERLLGARVAVALKKLRQHELGGLITAQGFIHPHVSRGRKQSGNYFNQTKYTFSASAVPPVRWKELVNETQI
jgi:hypothetical protein